MIPKQMQFRASKLCQAAEWWGLHKKYSVRQRNFLHMAILLVLMILIPLVKAQGQDPGIPDTVRLDDGVIPFWVGSAPISVHFTADESLT